MTGSITATRIAIRATGPDTIIPALGTVHIPTGIGMEIGIGAK